MTRASSVLAVSLSSSLLFIVGCGEAPRESYATAEEDAQALSRVEGTWEGVTPDGTVRLTFCEDPDPLTTIPATRGLVTCPTIAHEVRGGGRGVTEPVDLEQEIHHDELWGRTSTCTRVMAAPLTLRLESWCAPRSYRGAMVVATAPKPDLYSGPYPLTFDAPVDQALPQVRKLVWGELSEQAVVTVEYATGGMCPTPRCVEGTEAPCGAVEPLTQTIELHRVVDATTACAQ